MIVPAPDYTPIERLDSRQPLPEHLRGAIIAMGNFDGFHAGHHAVVERAIQWACAEERPAIVATFDPHPVRLFVPDAPPFCLTNMDQRQRLFAAAGADAMLTFRFDRELANRTAEEFVDFLVRNMGAAGVVTGEDFTFGKGRTGTVDLFAALGATTGLRNEAVAPVTGMNGEIISSSRIRDALKTGDCASATRLMTRPFAIESMVQHGAKLGRTLDFPTANMELGNYVRPAYGVYAVRGRLPANVSGRARLVDGVANLGIRPMIDPPKELLESYFFDFAEELYGQTIAVQLIGYIRPELKLDGLDALKAQIAKDCDAARQILAETPPLP